MKILLRFIYILSTASFLFSCQSKKTKYYKGAFYDNRFMESFIALSEIEGETIKIFKQREKSIDSLPFFIGTVKGSDTLRGVLNGVTPIYGICKITDNNFSITNEKNVIYFNAFIIPKLSFISIEDNSSDMKNLNELLSVCNNLRVKNYDISTSETKGKFIIERVGLSNLSINVHTSISETPLPIPDHNMFIIFDNYSKCSTDLINPSDYPHNTDLAEDLKSKNPIIIRYTESNVNYSGNRFNNGGLSRDQVGRTYDYGNYSYSAVRKEVELYRYDKITNKIMETSFGFVDDSINGFKLYSFYSQHYYPDYTNTELGKFLKNVSDFLKKNYECRRFEYTTYTQGRLNSLEDETAEAEVFQRDAYAKDILQKAATSTIDTATKKIISFSGRWYDDLKFKSDGYLDIEINKGADTGFSTITVYSNQLIYEYSNRQVGDTLFFYFKNSDAGRGGLGEINCGTISIPKYGKLIGKAILRSNKLIFAYKAEKMNISVLYDHADADD